MDVAFDTYNNMLSTIDFGESISLSILTFIVALIILVLLALVAANLTIEYCAAWILLYGGCFFLGFGGSKWTSDMALAYFKTILASAVRLMGMIMIVGIASGLITGMTSQISMETERLLPSQDLAKVLVISLITWSLMNKIPAMLASMVGGGQGPGNMGFGSVMFAASLGMAGYSAAKSAVGVAGAAAGYAGSKGGSAVKDYVSKALSGGASPSSGGSMSGMAAKTSTTGTGNAGQPSKLGQAASDAKAALGHLKDATRELGQELEK
jgi:P-type conjugative transfer protein TrbL